MFGIKTILTFCIILKNLDTGIFTNKAKCLSYGSLIFWLSPEVCMVECMPDMVAEQTWFGSTQV